MGMVFGFSMLKSNFIMVDFFRGLSVGSKFARVRGLG